MEFETNNNEEVVTEEVAENVEATATEENVEENKPAEKMFTQEEVNELIEKRHRRDVRRIEREFERKYRDADYLQNVVKAGLGTESVEEAADTLAGFYADKGKSIPAKPNAQIYSQRDLERLARADADEIIDSGYDDVREEIDRLTSIGATNMTAREKAVYSILTKHFANSEREKTLSSLGVNPDVYKSDDYKQFRRQFVEDTPEETVYKLYTQSKPQAKVEKIGSMKNTTVDDTKTFYSPDDVDKLSEKDYENPIIMKRVRESMTKW